MYSVKENYIFFGLYCSVHPEARAIYFDLSKTDYCICSKCAEQHTEKKNLVLITAVRDKEILNKVHKASIEEGKDDPDMIRNNIEAKFANIKDNVNSYLEGLKQSLLAKITKEYPRKKGWNSTLNDLQKHYEKIDSNEMSIESAEFYDFLNIFSNASQMLSKIDETAIVKFTLYNDEFDKLSKGIIEKIDLSRDKLLKIEKVNKVPNTPSKKFALKTITKLGTFKLGYKSGIKPTAICYLSGFESIAVSGGKDISVWNIVTYEKKFTLDDQHSEPICFMNYSSPKKVLMTSGYDRVVNLYAVKKNTLTRYRKIVMSMEDGISGFLNLENSGLVLSCGQSNKIRVWDAATFGLTAVIKSQRENSDFGPHMAYSKKEKLLATFLYKTGKVLVFCFKKRKLFDTVDTNLKANDVYSLDLVWIEKNSTLIVSKDYGKLLVVSFKDRKKGAAKEILINAGYSFGFINFEMEDYLLMMNYMKDLVVINPIAKTVVKNISVGFTNGSNIIHIKDLRRFCIPDMVTDKLVVFSY